MVDPKLCIKFESDKIDKSKRIKIFKEIFGEYKGKKIGNMMPKSFAVYEKSDGQVYVSTMNGAVMGKIFGGEVERIIEEVSLEVEDMMRFMNLKYTLF